MEVFLCVVARRSSWAAAHLSSRTRGESPRRHHTPARCSRQHDQSSVLLYAVSRTGAQQIKCFCSFVTTNGALCLTRGDEENYCPSREVSPGFPSLEHDSKVPIRLSRGMNPRAFFSTTSRTRSAVRERAQIHAAVGATLARHRGVVAGDSDPGVRGVPARDR
jgi:hypothetical protein